MGGLGHCASAGLRLATALAVLVLAGCASTPDRAGVSHVVRPGENLYRISKHYGVSVRSISRANRIRDVTGLQVGQRLRIPDSGKQQPSRRLSPSGGKSTSKSAGKTVRKQAPSGNREQALRGGHNVVTPNKDLIRAYGAELERLALDQGVRLAYHNSIATGWPLMFSVERSLARVRERRAQEADH